MTIEKYSVNNRSLQAVGLSVTGQVRSANEDSCGYEMTPNGELFVVCDGMGGHVGGATASRIGVQSILNHIIQNTGPKPQLLNDALAFANMQILGTASADPSLKGMGTTACIVLVDGNEAWMAHVGDSRIYLYSKEEKRLFRVSKDHSLVQGLVDKGELDDREAETHPQKNIILRALGTKMDVVPDVERMPMKLAKGDIILICSDGLSGMIDDDHIEMVLGGKNDLESKLQQLVGDANAPGKGKDNITCQLIQIEESLVEHNEHPNFNPRWRDYPSIDDTNKKRIWPWVIGASVVACIIMAVVALLIYSNMSNKNKSKPEPIELCVDSTQNISYLYKEGYDTLLIVQGGDSVVELTNDTIITALKEGEAELLAVKRSKLSAFFDNDTVRYDLKIFAKKEIDDGKVEEQEATKEVDPKTADPKTADPKTVDPKTADPKTAETEAKANEVARPKAIEEPLDAKKALDRTATEK